MFLRTITKTILLMAVFSTSSALATNAVNKDSYPLITYKCDTDKNILLITNTMLKGGQEKDFKYSDEDGTYSPWDMVTIKNNTITDSKSVKKECKLKSAQYTVVLEPQVFNPKLANQQLDGFCGATISAAVTIVSDDIELLERKALEFHCSGNTKIITGIKLIDKTGEIKIREVPRHKYY